MNEEIEAWLDSMPVSKIEEIYDIIGYYLIDRHIVRKPKNEKK